MSVSGVFDLKSSGAVTASGSSTQSADVGVSGLRGNAAVLLDVTAVSGTSPTMTVSVQWSNDGVAWHDGETADSFTAITAAKKVTRVFTTKGAYARLSWTVGGTTPSFTFSASCFAS